MKLEEAKEIIKSIDTLDDYELQEAIETVIGELFAMQNLLDEKNEEIEHLQKENEEYKNRNEILESCKYVDSIEIIRAKLEECERWINKIREKIKEIYEDENSEYYDMFLEQRDIEKTISILKDLLKEE